MNLAKQDVLRNLTDKSYVFNTVVNLLVHLFLISFYNITPESHIKVV